MNKELQSIPGVGRRTAEDLILIGINSIKDLKNKNPEELYERLCMAKGQKLTDVYYMFSDARYITLLKNCMIQKNSNGGIGKI